MYRNVTVVILSCLLILALTGATVAQQSQAAQRINFAPGAISATESGSLTMGGMDRYVLGAEEGQNMTVSVASADNNALLVIYGRDGTVLISDHADASSWSGVLPSTQDYFIDVRAIDGSSANYTLTVTIPPNPPSPPHPSIQRISFAPGTISATVHGSVTPGGYNEYVLKASAGQNMLVRTTAEEQQVAISVVGADGTVLLSSMAGADTFSGDLPSTQDYFIKVEIDGEGFAMYQMTVTVEPLVY